MRTRGWSSLPPTKAIGPALSHTEQERSNGTGKVHRSRTEARNLWKQSPGKDSRRGEHCATEKPPWTVPPTNSSEN